MVKLTYRPPAYLAIVDTKNLRNTQKPIIGILRELREFNISKAIKACYSSKVWVSESVPVWAPQLSH